MTVIKEKQVIWPKSWIELLEYYLIMWAVVFFAGNNILYEYGVYCLMYSNDDEEYMRQYNTMRYYLITLTPFNIRIFVSIDLNTLIVIIKRLRDSFYSGKPSIGFGN